MRNYTACFWDMDGTLVDSGDMWKATIEQSLIEHGVRFTQEEKIRAASIPLKKILREKGIPEDIIEAIYVTLYTLVEQKIKGGAVTWRKGAEEMLSKIKIPQALITSSSQISFDLIDAQLGIRQYMKHIITGEDVQGKYKPDPFGIHLACQELGVRPEDIIMIGDQQCDLDAAKNAGADAILIRAPDTPNNVTHTKVVVSFKGLQEYFRESFQLVL